MPLIKPISLLLILGLSLQAHTLKELINASEKNELVQAYVNNTHAAQKAYDATRSSYFPRINFGASASKVNEKNPFEAGENYSAFVTADFVILDGFKRENLLDEKSAQIQSETFNLEGFKKALALQVSELFFSLQNTQADIEAQHKKKAQLQEQLTRLEKFFRVGLATEDDVQRIHAALANSDYAIVSLEYQADVYLSKLELLTALKPITIEKSELTLPSTTLSSTLMDSISAKAYTAQALSYKAEQVDASHYPTLLLQDKFSFNEYGDDDFPAALGTRLNQQNRIMLTLSMNLFDFSALSEQKEVVLLQKEALKNQISYEKKSAQADLELAKRSITRAKKLIEAATLSRHASEKTFHVIKKKYNARVVDYVKYLDALFQLTEAQSQYNQAHNALNLAYANFYYYSGKNPKDFIK